MKTADKFGLLTDENFSHELLSSRNNKIQSDNKYAEKLWPFKKHSLKIEKIAHKLKILTRKLLTNGLKFSPRVRVRILKQGPVL